ncbi:RNase A-like domain-containing protein, partial [Pseudomonas viridiflava]
MAEWAVSQALRRNRLKILLQSKARLLLKDKRYEFSTVLERSVGWGITRANPDKPIQMTKVTIIIKFAEYN